MSEKGDRRNRLVAFLVPPLVITALLYRALSELQITLTHPETLVVVGTCLAVAVAAGVVAATAGRVATTLVLSTTVVLLFDVILHGPRYLDALQPEIRSVRARDAARVRDMANIQNAVERYITDKGSLPVPAAYGEGSGPPAFWEGWWDLSAIDGDGDGQPFMKFLVDGGYLNATPVDPVNETSDPIDPRAGHQYVYYLSPPGYSYEGGHCASAEGRGTYLLAITAFETPAAQRPEFLRSPGCACLWNDKPDFFSQFFDYVACGTFSQTR